MPENYGERLATIEAKLDAYAQAQTERWEDIDHRLFGNGQPGIVREFNSRITKLEHFRFWFGGVLAACSMVGGAAAHKLIDWFSASYVK